VETATHGAFEHSAAVIRAEAGDLRELEDGEVRFEMSFDEVDKAPLNSKPKALTSIFPDTAFSRSTRAKAAPAADGKPMIAGICLISASFQ
jgi:hypothetical protein